MAPDFQMLLWDKHYSMKLVAMVLREDATETQYGRRLYRINLLWCIQNIVGVFDLVIISYGSGLKVHV
jgi:hypothetical protein